MRIGVIAVLVVAVAVVGRPNSPIAETASAPAADRPADPDNRWASLLLRYGADPMGTRRELAAAERDGVDRLPAPVLLALADVQLRSRRWQAASRYCEQVLRRDPGEPWTDWARLGLAAAALGAGKETEARRHFDVVAEGGSGGSGVASMAIALLEGAHGRFEAAERAFGS